MEMQKILIADGADEFREALADALHGIYSVETCSDGNTALELAGAFAPDILVLDLTLPGLDGLSLLQALHKSGREMTVLATTRFLSTYVEEAAARLGVSYLMLKPCSVRAVVARIGDLSRAVQTIPMAAADMRTMVSNILLELNIAAKRRGYGCLREAILLMLENPGQSITKELYPAVAEVCGGSREQVERVIRTAIDAAWRSRDEGKWRAYFLPGPDGHIPRPTNAAFICRLADSLALEKDA